MAKKTTQAAKARSAPPASPAPELDASAPDTAPASARRRAARAPGAAKPTASRAARASDPMAEAPSSPPVRRPRRASQLPTQAVEQAQTPAPMPPPESVSDEDVRMRAYFLSLERGPHGSEVEHWLQAEMELRPKSKPKP